MYVVSHEWVLPRLLGIILLKKSWNLSEVILNWVPHVFACCLAFPGKMETAFGSCHWPLQKGLMLFFFPSSSLNPQNHPCKCKMRPSGWETPKTQWPTSFTWPLAMYDRSLDSEGVLEVRVEARSLTVREMQGYMATPTSCWQMLQGWIKWVLRRLDGNLKESSIWHKTAWVFAVVPWTPADL